MKSPRTRICDVCGIGFPGLRAMKRCSKECSEKYLQSPENREKARQYAKTYDQLPENKERRKYRRSKPKNKKKRQQEMKAYHSLPYVKKRRHMQYIEKKNQKRLKEMDLIPKASTCSVFSL